MAQNAQHCNPSTNTVTDPNATFTVLSVTGLSSNYCFGGTVSASASYTNTDGQIITTTTASDCSTSSSSNSCSASLLVSNCTWTASVGSFSTNGAGITATFTPTDCGVGTVSFHVAWTNACDGSTGSGDVSGSFNVVKLLSLGVANAVSVGGTNNWAAVKTTNANDFVTLTATLCPNNADAAALLTWSGGEADPNNPLQRRVPKNVSAKTAVTASCCSSNLSATIWIVWSSFTEFNNTGPKNSDSDVQPPAFGMNDVKHNGTLMQVTITPAGFGAFTNVSYDIKRTKEGGIWSKNGTTWQQDTHLGPPPNPGGDDDAFNTDEDLIPSSSDHIYSTDWPGFNLATPFADEAVQKGSFVEWVTINLGGWTRCSDDYPWHSIVWLEKNGTVWKRKASASNEIELGATTVGTNSTP